MFASTPELLSVQHFKNALWLNSFFNISIKMPQPRQLFYTSRIYQSVSPSLYVEEHNDERGLQIDQIVRVDKWNFLFCTFTVEIP